jgi:hypothetical protein
MTGKLVFVGERIAGGSGTSWVRLAIVVAAAAITFDGNGHSRSANGGLVPHPARA